MPVLRTFVILAHLLTTARAQFNLPLAISELPACSVSLPLALRSICPSDNSKLSCGQQLLPAAECKFPDIPNCFCTNSTLQLQFASCVQESCNRTEVSSEPLTCARFELLVLKACSCHNRVPKPFVQRRSTALEEQRVYPNRDNHICNRLSNYSSQAVLSIPHLTALVG